jgi:hypothetical protein
VRLESRSDGGVKPIVVRDIGDRDPAQLSKKSAAEWMDVH